jgi:hypothetical protein
MLIASTPTDVPISAFPAEAHATPPLDESVTQDAIVAELYTLTAQVKFLAESVTTVVASSSRPNRGNDGRVPIVCAYCDNRGHIESHCFKRQCDLKPKTEAETLTVTVILATSVPFAPTSPSPPAAGVPWAMPSYLALVPLVVEDTSFVSDDVSFFDLPRHCLLCVAPPPTS